MKGSFKNSTSTGSAVLNWCDATSKINFLFKKNHISLCMYAYMLIFILFSLYLLTFHDIAVFIIVDLSIYVCLIQLCVYLSF